MAKTKKNEVAVALGRLGGGIKGGKARAEKLSAERRTEIAVKAVRARWCVMATMRGGSWRIRLVGGFQLTVLAEDEPRFRVVAEGEMEAGFFQA